MNFIKKHWKALLFILFEFACLALAIGGIGWTDYAETKFWQVGWVILAILGVFGFIGGMWWMNNQKNQKF
jgi:hypothetical protein